MVCIDHEARGDALEDLFALLLADSCLGPPGAVGDPIDKRVHRNRGFAKGGIEYHVCGLAAHARQGLQRSGARHPATMQVYQQPAGLQQVPGLAVVQANGLDARLQPIQSPIENRLRRVGHGNQFACGLVDTDVGLAICSVAKKP